MLVTSFQVKKIENTNNKLQGVATIVLDNMLVLHEIKILKADDRFFLAMPSKKTKSGGFKDIFHPIKSEVRQVLENLIISGYQKVEQEGYIKLSFVYNEVEQKTFIEQTLADFAIDEENSFYVYMDSEE